MTDPITPEQALAKRVKDAVHSLRNGGEDDPYVRERSEEIDYENNDDGATHIHVADDCKFCIVPSFEGQPMRENAYQIAGAGRLIADLWARVEALTKERDHYRAIAESEFGGPIELPCSVEWASRLDQHPIIQEYALVRREHILPLLRERDELRAKLESSPKWIPCVERMPSPSDGQVLGWSVGCVVGFVWLSDSPPDCPACRDCPRGPHLHGALWSNAKKDHVSASCVTHWMPSPKGPQS